MGEWTALLLTLLLVATAISIPLVFCLNAERLATFIRKQRAKNVK